MPEQIERAEYCARLLLHTAPGLGPARMNSLINIFQTAEAILRAPNGLLCNVPGIGWQTVRKLREHVAARRDSIQRESSALTAASKGYRLLMRGDAAYPESLMQLAYGPPFLWLAGDPTSLGGPAVAVIGSRRPSPEARTIAYNTGFSLAAAGYIVVSGLAYGIDAESHKGALDAGGQTVAVLGSGLLRVYPAIHQKLAGRIRLSGAVISEFPLKSPPSPGHFPRRNRIISGLCLATVVVEAYEKGGALITARIALDQNHDVYAFPGSSGNAAASGTNRLIQSGEAHLVQSAREIITELDSALEPRDLRKIQLRREKESAPERMSSNTSENVANPKAVIRSDHTGAISPSDVLRELAEKPLHFDELCRRFGNRSPLTLVPLIKLENGGIVRRLPGGYFAVRRIKK